MTHEKRLQIDDRLIAQFLTVLSFVLLLPVSSIAQEEPARNIRVGLIADVQYVDGNSRGPRKYRKSLQKLPVAVQTLNREGVDLTIQLGDLIERNIKSFKPILARLNKLKMPLYHVLGNHDFSIGKRGDAVQDILDLDKRYYQFQVRNWRFIVLDGNDLSTLAWPKSHKKHQRAKNMRKKIREAGAPNAKSWNGGIGDKQIKWLRSVLKQADQQNQRAIILCHYPVYPLNGHNLYNDGELIKILEEHFSPVAYLSGHNHGGNYGKKNGIQYITLRGMVETNKNSFSIMELSPDQLKIRGFGREKNRTLAITDQPGGK